MGQMSRLVISARLGDVRQACDAVVEMAETAGLDERAVYHCQMAVDESLTNVIEHGYLFEGAEHEIEIVCQAEKGEFTIIITDDGPAFNPLEHQSPDPAQPLDGREPGGWGIYFIRKLMDEVIYRRVGDRNELTLVKRIAADQSAEPLAGEGTSPFPVRLLNSGTAIIAPHGRLDSNASPLLDKVLAAQLEKQRHWLFVDMEAVEYIASSGLKVLVSAWRRAREHGGDVILSGLQPRLIEIFEMVGFDMLFQIFPDLDSALAAQPKK